MKGLHTRVAYYYSSKSKPVPKHITLTYILRSLLLSLYALKELPNNLHSPRKSEKKPELVKLPVMWKTGAATGTRKILSLGAPACVDSTVEKMERETVVMKYCIYL